MVRLVEQIARRVVAGDALPAEGHQKAPVGAKLVDDVGSGVGHPKESLCIDRHAVRALKQAVISKGLHEFAVTREQSKIRRRAHQHQDVSFSIRRDPRGVAIPGRPLRKLSPVRVNFIAPARLRR